jgi:hypothetical protein
MAKTTPILQLKIDNKEDIDLQDFNNAIQSLNSQYYSFLKTANAKKVKSTHKLYLKEVRKGSIIIELCEKTPELLPIIAPYIVEFGSYVASTMDWLVGRVPAVKHKLVKKDFFDFKNIFQLAANVKGNSTGFVGINFGTVKVDHQYNDVESGAGQNKCLREIEAINEVEPESFIKYHMELDLYQARNSNLSKAGSMGIIKEISDKPKVLSYATERLRYDLTKAEDNPFNFTYTVDVQVKLKDGKNNYEDHNNIQDYEILKLHGVVSVEDLFDKKKS